MSAYSVVQKSGHEISLEQSRGAAFARAREEAQWRNEPVEVVWKGKTGYKSKWFRPRKANPRVRAKVNAAVVAWKKMNPGKKVPAVIKIKPIAGGGFSVTPVKANAGPLSFRKFKKAFKKSAMWKRGGGGRVHEETLHAHLKAQKRPTGHRGRRRAR